MESRAARTVDLASQCLFFPSSCKGRQEGGREGQREGDRTEGMALVSKEVLQVMGTMCFNQIETQKINPIL